MSVLALKERGGGGGVVVERVSILCEVEHSCLWDRGLLRGLANLPWAARGPRDNRAECLKLGVVS